MKKKAEKIAYIVKLVVVFAVCFLIPVAFVIYNKVGKEQGNPVIKEYFQHARRLPKKVGRLQVVNSHDLNPKENEDFLIEAWFLLNKNPKEDERIILLNKYDKKQKGVPGYAVALEYQNNQYIPYVYWNDATGKGRWFRFSEAKIVPKAWFMLALSYRENHILGLHIASTHSASGDKIQLLGGYNFEENIIPENRAELFLGGSGSYGFHGFIGPLGIFSAKNLTRNYNKLYRKLFLKPNVIASELKNSVLLWTIDGTHDMSGQDRSIKRESVYSKKKYKKKLEQKEKDSKQ